jgi:hypothetical protein
MRVSPKVSVDIGVDARREEFKVAGTDLEIAADVRLYVQNIVHAQMSSLGVLAD